MDDETLKLVSALPTADMDALEISGDFWRSRRSWRSYVNAWYPTFDLTHNVMPKAQWDFVVAEQVFEHVRYPYRGMNNIRSLLRPGGWALITVPFLIQVHGSPSDYTRWTADGLRYFMEECGFRLETIQAAQWGNRECVVSDFESCERVGNWTDYVEGQHSLENHPWYPASVWALGAVPG
jgi:SAM-dependent methyltransferase